ncbi:MAG: hypothetical protein L0177_14200 [Chloroflexi bacterium]|nr:hypothetical protein [Chloroflexota bacterium]
MLRLRTLVFLMALAAMFAATSQAALAQDSPASRSTVVIVLDSEAIASSERGADITKSAVGLISSLRDRDDFFFAATASPKQALGPVSASEPEFESLQGQLFASLGASQPGVGQDIVSAFAELYNLLQEAHAPGGSTVYLISGGESRQDLSRAAGRLSPTLGLFKQNGWAVSGLILPGASTEAREFLSRVSSETGSVSLELAVPDGLKSLSDRILREKATGSLSEVASADVTPNDVLTSNISVVPGTSEAAFLFFKSDSGGSLSVRNPSGVEATMGDRASSRLIQTPFAIIWKLVDPQPGNWRVDITGVSGSVSAWNSSSNKYSIVLESFGAVPVGEPATIGAYVTDGRQRAVLDGVRLVARITNPNGSTFVQELNDNGIQGDAMARDGFFAATLPPLPVSGDYRVDLELSWPQYEYRISSKAAFSAQPFPTITMTPVEVGEVRPGQRAKIATLFVNIDGQPYAVSTEQLIADIAFDGEIDKSKVLEVNPTRTLDQGRAWEYEVFFTPQQDGFHTAIFHLSLEYAGKQRSFSTEPIVLSARSPLPPQPAVPTAPAVQQAPPPAFTPAPATFPWALLVIPGLAVAGLIAAFVNWLVRTRPYGYLYNDQNELVIDFSKMTRNPLKAFLFRNSVTGRELGLQGLEDVSFEFSAEDVDLRSKQLTPTVRVNNQPLIERMSLRERAWIGAQGKLYSFLRSPLRLEGEPGLADD